MIPKTETKQIRSRYIHFSFSSPFDEVEVKSKNSLYSSSALCQVKSHCLMTAPAFSGAVAMIKIRAVQTARFHCNIHSGDRSIPPSFRAVFNEQRLHESSWMKPAELECAYQRPCGKVPVARTPWVFFIFVTSLKSVALMKQLATQFFA